MSNSYESIKKDAGYFAAGAGLYYIGIWIFSFYPAFILSMIFQRTFFDKHTEEAGASVLGLVVMIVFTFIIVGLVKFKQYFIVLMIYLLTAWPFLFILNHCCHAEEWRDGVWIAIYPLPLDFWPLW